METKKFKITTKEVGCEKPIISYYWGPTNEDKLIEFFGLKNDDVEWYLIEECTDDD